jgi:16S rRNA (uracil1498-N3)-methyltransferase
MPVFFLPAHAIAPPAVSITGDVLTHVRDSLRVHEGDTLLVGDGRGRRYRVAVTGVAKHELTARILDAFVQPPRKIPSIILAQALLKGDKMDWVIQKATELGAQTILPLQTRNSVVQPKAERIVAQVARWRRIALEAAQQSEQWSVPTVATPQALVAYCSTATSTLRVILAERRDNSASFENLTLPNRQDASVTVLVGPEGGWSQEDVAAAEQAGFLPVTLGRAILRAETAAIAAMSILQFRLGGLH